VNIHPTAIVESGAQISDEVQVGAYSIIGPEVRIGVRTTIESHVVIEGTVEIGSDNVIGHGSVIGGLPQDLSYKSETHSGVRIGNSNKIREHCTIHRGTSDGSFTTIGDRNFLMVGVHLGHNCAIANEVIIANNCLLAGYVEIHDHAFIGGGTTFHQHMRVGRLVMAQGSSAFGKDIPPFVIAAERNYVFGLNVVGLRRAGFSAKDRDEIKAAFKLVYTSGLNITQAIEEAATIKFAAAAREFIDFVAHAKERGVCPLKRGADDPEMSI